MLFSDWLQIKEGKKDACYHKVKARYNVFPSAYASGALVKCRKVGAKNWGNKKKKRKKSEDQFSSEEIKSENKLLTFEMFCENKFKKEKEQGLHGWFSRNKGKGWVDCKASKKGHIVPCGRKKAGKGADRKYPACRPTLSMCNAKGKRRKKSSKPISWE